MKPLSNNHQPPEEAASLRPGVQSSQFAFQPPSELVHTLETRAFKNLEERQIIVEIARWGRQIQSLVLYEYHTDMDQRDGFRVEILADQLSNRLNDLFVGEPPLARIIDALESSRLHQPSACEITMLHSVSALWIQSIRSALLHGESSQRMRQVRDLSELLHGDRREVQLLAKAAEPDRAMVLAIDSLSSSNGRSEVEMSVIIGEREVLSLKRRAASPWQADELALAVRSVKRTFELSTVSEFIEYVERNRGLVLPIDVAACEPKFVYGRHLNRELVEVGSECLLTQDELFHARDAQFNIVAYSVVNKFSPCRFISLMIDENRCRSMGITFTDGSRLMVMPNESDLFEGDASELDAYVDRTLGDFCANPFSVISDRAGFTLQRAQQPQLTIYVDPDLVASCCVAYHLWSLWRDDPSVFPSDFKTRLQTADLLGVGGGIPLLSGNPIALTILPGPGGIRQVEVFERRSWYSRVFSGESYISRGLYQLESQRDLGETGDFLDEVLRLARGMSAAGLGWYEDNKLHRFLS